MKKIRVRYKLTAHNKSKPAQRTYFYSNNEELNSEISKHVKLWETEGFKVEELSRDRVK